MRVCRRGVTVALLGIVALTVRSSAHFGASGSVGSDGSLSFVPKEAVVCVRVDLEGIVEDAKPLKEIPRLVLEAIGKASGKDLLKEFERGMPRALGIVWKEFTLAISPAEEGETEGAETPARILSVCRPGDLEKAEELMGRFREWNDRGGHGFSEEKHGDSAIIHQPGMAYAFADGHIVFGTSVGAVEAALDAHRSPEKRLESSERFQGLRAELRTQPDILAYVDFFPLVQMGALAPRLPGHRTPVPGGSGAGGARGLSLGLPPMAPEQMEILKGIVSIVGVDFTREGVEVQNIDQPGEALRKLMAGLTDLPPVDRGLLERMPSSALALAAMTSPAKVWALTKTIRSALPGTAGLLGMLEKGASRAGLDLERDIIGWMKGTAAAGVYYQSEPFPNLLIAWDVPNPDEAEEALGRIVEAVSNATDAKVQFVTEKRETATVIRVRVAGLEDVPFLTPAIGITERTLYMSSSEGGLERALGGSSGSAAEAVAQVPNGAHLLGMIDFPAISQIVTGLAPPMAGGEPSGSGRRVQEVLQAVGEVLNSFGKATGYSQIRSDGSSIEGYNLPVNYEALVSALAGLVERIPTRPRQPVVAPPTPITEKEKRGPVCAKVGLTEDGSKVLSVVFDRSDERVKGYDVLYADTNFNGGFEQAERVEAEEISPAGEGRADEPVFREFPPVNLDVAYNEKGEGIRHPWSLVFHYYKFPVQLFLPRGVGTETHEEFLVQATMRLREDATEWQFVLDGRITTADSLDKVTRIGRAA